MLPAFSNLLRAFASLRSEHPQLVRFAAIGLLGFVAWYGVYSYWLRPATLLDEWVIHSLVLTAEAWMEFSGWEVSPAVEQGLRHRVGMVGTNGVQIGDPCDGVVLFALFALFLVAIPGPAVHKAWFIPAGTLVLHAVNAARVVALLHVQRAAPEWLQFNHDYLFTVLVYGVVFGLWYSWLRWFVMYPRMPHHVR